MKFYKVLGLSVLTTILLGVGLFSINNSQPSQQIEAIETKASYDSYYEKVDLSSKLNLYKSLTTIINTGVKTCTYDNLVSKLQITDWDANGVDDSSKKGRIVDMYSDSTNFGKNDNGGSYSYEGHVWNKEHLIPKSWWGDGKNGTGKGEGGDAFNMYPTDGKINGMRSNYPMGEVSSATSSSNHGFSKLGLSSFSGYSGTVFEPNDKYKGDIARAYFYFATKNQNNDLNGGYSYDDDYGSVIFSGSKNYMLTNYASALFYKWHKLDPVSDWEKLRCEQVYGVQKNRNPFIDHPEYVDVIWGDKELDPIKITSISLSSNSLNLNQDQNNTITATISPSNATNQNLDWTTSNSLVATVNDGIITAKGTGTCTITASAKDGSNISASCQVTVSKKVIDNPILITDISIPNHDITLNISDTYRLYCQITPGNPTTPTLSYTSTDNNVATVDDKGLITAVGVGKCTITISSTDGGNVKTECQMTVKDPKGTKIDDPVEPINSGCAGSVIASSAILSTISLAGAMILVLKKKRK